jgi:hypothetical protein
MLCTSRCSAIQNRRLSGLESSLSKRASAQIFTNNQFSRMYRRPSPLFRPFMNPLPVYGKFTSLAADNGGDGKLGGLSAALWSRLMTLTMFYSAPRALAAAAHQIVSAIGANSRLPSCPDHREKC